MIITDESWYIVRNTKGVTGFVGPGSKPVPLTDDEVKSMGIELDRVAFADKNVDLEEGEVVKVIKGPFKGNIGTVKEINLEFKKVTVYIEAFGTKTPIELEFESIERI